MEKFLYAGLTVVTGMFVGLHLAMNGRLGGSLRGLTQSDVRAAAAANGFFWAIGAVVAVTLFFALRVGSPRELLAAAQKPMLAAGAIGATLVLAITFLIPARIGAGPGFVFLVLGQVLIGLVLSHFGWLGSAVDAFTWKKALGLGLLAGGLYFTVAG